MGVLCLNRVLVLVVGSLGVHSMVHDLCALVAVIWMHVAAHVAAQASIHVVFRYVSLPASVAEALQKGSVNTHVTASAIKSVDT